MTTAIECIYRDLEYARSLIKHPIPDSEEEEEEIDEDGTIRRRRAPSPGLESSGGSKGAPSEDWSVISDQEDRRSSFSSSNGNEGRPGERSAKRNLAAAVLSVLPDFGVPGSPRRRTLSASSQS